jgi:hypothetical protein
MVAAYQIPAHAGRSAERVAHLFADANPDLSPEAVTGSGIDAQLPDNWYKIMAEREGFERI